MVSLNCHRVIAECLRSLSICDGQLSKEIIIVDNCSADGTIDFVRQTYPDVKCIQNKENLGFTIATNQAIRMSSGRFVLWLNTDTILLPGSLLKLVRFMEQNARVGIVGPKVLNPDGTFQPQCKRGRPTPLASICYLLGLDRCFPEDQNFAQYLLRYLPCDHAHRVTAVSGCCLMARREVWNRIGPLDERIFGFGEDIDWCIRAEAAGWDVWYYPESVIIHLKGMGGAHSKPFHKVWGIHQSMWIIYRKHFEHEYSLAVSISVRLAIAANFAVECLKVLAKRIIAKIGVAVTILLRACVCCWVA